MLSGLFSTLPPEREDEATEIYQAIFPGRPISAWTRQGTLITRYVNGKKLNFAGRRQHCTIGFQGHDAIEFYRLSEGRCSVGEVTIKIFFGQEWDPGPIRETIDWYFHN